VIYAGIPTVSSLTPAAGPVTGGSTITLTGQGLSAVAPSAGGFLEYIDLNIGIPRDQLSNITIGSDTSLTATTPQVLAGTDVVTACTVSGCSFPNTEKAAEKASFIFYLPGNPIVTKVTPRHGPASGGSILTLKGHNLSNPISVRFGTHTINIAQDDFGSTSNEIELAPPPGHPGHTVKISVTTAESKYAAGGAPSPVTTATTYRYVVSPPSAPRKVTTNEHHSSVHVHWVKPLVDGGAKITGYRVIINALNLFGHKQPKPVKMKVGPKARSAVFKGLDPQVFVAEVRAINKHGAGPPEGAIFPKKLGGSGGGGVIIFFLRHNLQL
jgi:hypothetical protein